ncbi:hypothetical protein GCM10023116_28260 [Kistimonas scapharcae]|uniref:Uncharacterized protein n=1 Tax=Kistimonas scapharcae TaxID=1036133 RepID=A0ABP8V522_9GAMM
MFSDGRHDNGVNDWSVDARVFDCHDDVTADITCLSEDAKDDWECEPKTVFSSQGNIDAVSSVSSSDDVLLYDDDLKKPKLLSIDESDDKTTGDPSHSGLSQASAVMSFQPVPLSEDDAISGEKEGLVVSSSRTSIEWPVQTHDSKVSQHVDSSKDSRMPKQRESEETVCIADRVDAKAVDSSATDVSSPASGGQTASPSSLDTSAVLPPSAQDDGKIIAERDGDRFDAMLGSLDRRYDLDVCQSARPRLSPPHAAEELTVDESVQVQGKQPVRVHSLDDSMDNTEKSVLGFFMPKAIYEDKDEGVRRFIKALNRCLEVDLPITSLSSGQVVDSSALIICPIIMSSRESSNVSAAINKAKLSDAQLKKTIFFLVYPVAPHMNDPACYFVKSTNPELVKTLRAGMAVIRIRIGITGSGDIYDCNYNRKNISDFTKILDDFDAHNSDKTKSCAISTVTEYSASETVEASASPRDRAYSREGSTTQTVAVSSRLDKSGEALKEELTLMAVPSSSEPAALLKKTVPTIRIPNAICSDARYPEVIGQLINKTCPDNPVIRNISSFDTSTVILFPVIIESRAGSNICGAIDKIEAEGFAEHMRNKTILVCLHHIAPHIKSFKKQADIPTEAALKNEKDPQMIIAGTLKHSCKGVVDIVFWNKELRDSDENKAAFETMKRLLAN